MSSTPRAASALPLLLACVSLGAGACLSPDDPAPTEDPATLEEQSHHVETGETISAPPATAAAASTSLFTTQQKLDFVPGELILTPDKDTKLVAGQAIEVAGVRLMPVRRLHSGAWLALLPSAASAHAAISAGRPLDTAALAAAEQLTLSARDAVAGAPGIERATINLVLEFSATPSDPFYWSYQRWHYDAVRMPGAWDYGGGHSGVRLAIIDTETNQGQHPDLMWRWGDSFDFSGAPQTYHHGLHVAGIAGAAADGNLGVGICWGCQLLPYRMNGSVFGIAEAIDRAAGDDFGPPRAEVINLSLNRRNRFGSSARLLCSDFDNDNDPNNDPTAVRLALARAISRGVTVVVSAGNFGDQGPAFPGDCPNVISVAAVQPSAPVVVGNPVPTAAGIAAYSNRGSSSSHGAVTLAAPGGGGDGNSQFGAMLPEMPCPPPHVSALGGVDPFSGTVGVVGPFANYTDPVAPGGYCYRFLSGTSMSAPHVTGTVGLMKSRNSALTPAQAKDILSRTAQINTPCPVGTCGAGLLNAHAATRYAPDAGVPSLISTAPNFGNVAVGSQVVANVQLTNNGSATVVAGYGAPMQILGGAGMIEFAYPSGCTSGTSCSVPAGIGPGSSHFVPLRCRPTSAGVIGATLRIPSNRFDPQTGAVDAQLNIAISCTAFVPTPDVTVTPTSLGFGSINVGSTSSAQLVTVRNDGGGTLAVTASESTADYNLTCQSGCSCTASSCTASLTANQSAVLAVTFSPQAPGVRNATLTISTPGDPDEPTTNVALSGNGLPVIPDVTVFPGSLGFPATPVGNTTAAQTFSVRNDGGGTLAVTASETSPEYTLTCQSNCACSGASCTASLGANQMAFFAVTFSPQAPGARNATLTVATNDPDEPTTNVLLFGNGTQPALEVRPNPLHAGAVHVGSSGTASGVLYNPGNGTLRVTQMSLTGAQAGIFGFTCGGRPCAPPFDVAAGTSHALEVRCTPTHNAPYAASLVVTSNAPGSPHTATVQCQGLAPEIAVTPSSGLDFGVVDVGTSASANLNLHDVNAGLGTTLSWSASVSSGVYALSCVAASSCTCSDDICYGTNAQALRVTFSPLAAPAANANVTIISNDPLHPVVSRPVTGSGRLWLVREQPAGGLHLSYGSSGELRVRNQGSTNITISNVDIVSIANPGGPTAFTFTGPTTATLAPGAAQSWAVSCGATIGVNALFNITSNAPGTGLLQTSLTCDVLTEEPLPPPDPPPQEM